MKFLAFIENKQRAAEPISQAPEQAKQMYAREAAQDKANTPPVTSIPAQQLSQAQALGEKMKAIPTEPAPATTPPATPSAGPAPAGEGNQQPMQQLSMAQGKEAPDLSPTSAQMGVKEADGPVSPSPTPSPAQSLPKPSRAMSPDF